MRRHLLGMAVLGFLLSWLAVLPASSETQTPTVNYYLPYSTDFTATVSQGPGGTTSHNTASEKGAYDFLLGGGEVWASAPGTVVAVRDTVTGQSGGYPNPESQGNYVSIKHADGSCTHYLHLAHGSVDVSKGDEVGQGQKLGLEGNTGYTLPIGRGHHLHFERDNCGPGHSYTTTFVEASSRKSQNAQGTPTVGNPDPDIDGDGVRDSVDRRPYVPGMYYLDGFPLLVNDHDSDYDGDGRTDVAVWRSNSGYWYFQGSSGTVIDPVQWGSAGATDIPVPGDYDGDGKTDVSVWRENTGFWYIIQSSGGVAASQYGAAEDIPVSGDYDGDGKTDIAIWRPSTGYWFAQLSDGGVLAEQFGSQLNFDVPVPGDYDGDGKTDIAIWRSTSGDWFIKSSLHGAVISTSWGTTGATDIPVPSDYDGDGKTDIAIWFPSTGEWLIQRSSDGGTSSQLYGSAGMGDIPVPGHYDGDNKTDIAVWRTGSGTWFVHATSGDVVDPQNFGSASMTDIPV